MCASAMDDPLGVEIALKLLECIVETQDLALSQRQEASQTKGSPSDFNATVG